MSWEIRKRTENAFRIAINRLWKRILKEVNKRPTSEWAGWIRRIAKSDEMASYALRASASMVTGVKVENALSWRMAASQSTRGSEIYSSLRNELDGPVGATVKNLVERNAKLITSVPEGIADEITDYIAKQHAKGIRPEAMEEEIRKLAPNLSQGRARVIARTETSKAASAITRARAEKLGARWYIWHTAQDGTRVRKSHRHMEGVLVRWDEPPSPESLVGEKSSLGRYNAGNAPNCRCYSEALIDARQIKSDVVKVYHDGRITKMTKAQFLDENSIRVA